MSIGVSYNFIDLTDGEWHMLPQNAENIVFECFDSNTQAPQVSIGIKTSHGEGSAEHTLATIKTNAGTNEKDHLELNASDTSHPFVLQRVKADYTGTETIYVRVYFSHSRRAR